MKTLTEVRKYLNRIPFINNGGCGIAAYAMYLWLKKNKKSLKDFKFVMLYDNWAKTNYINNQDVLKNKSGKARGSTHIIIYYDKKYMDCETTDIDLSIYQFIQMVKEEWFIKNCLINETSWNPKFNRDKYIPLIEKDLDISFTKIKKHWIKKILNFIW